MASPIAQRSVPSPPRAGLARPGALARAIRAVLLSALALGAAPAPAQDPAYEQLDAEAPSEPRWFPSEPLFAPPLAAGREIVLGGALHQAEFGDADELLGVARLGGSVPLLRFGMREGTDAWQLGFGAGVTSVFELEDDSQDLINADYIAALSLEWADGPLGARARLYHRSSHLGDEFLLRSEAIRAARIDLSFEALELVGDIELGGFRVYLGGERIISTVTPLQRHRFLGGVEWRDAPAGESRYLVALDASAWQETDETDLTLMAGLALGGPSNTRRQVWLMLEIYEGSFPYGQLYDREARWAGLGLAWTY